MTIVAYGSGPNSVSTNVTQIPFSNSSAIISGSFTNSFTAVSTITAPTQNVTVTGLMVGDMVLVTKKTAQAGLLMGGVSYVSTANTLPVTFVNPTAGSITPTASDTYYYTIVRPLYYTTTLPLNTEGGGTY